MNNVLKDISNKDTNMYILDICKRLNKKCNIKSVKDLELLSILGTYMYAIEDFDNAIKILSITDEVKFSGNWDIWNWIYTCQILKARVYSKLGKNDISEEIKRDLNMKTTGGSLNWQSNVDTICTVPSDGKYDYEIEKALEENDLKYAFELRVSKLIYLLKYIEGSVFKDKVYESKLKSADELIKEIINMDNI